MYILLGVGVVALSTAVIFVKLSDMPPSLLASGRLLVAAAVLVPFLIAERRTGKAVLPVRALLPAATLLAAHFITWFIGIRLTTAANASLIVNLSPVAMPFALYLMVGEKVTRREVWGSALAVVGVLVLAAGSARVEKAGLIGDLICIGSMTLAVGYLVSAKRARQKTGDQALGIFGYLVPLYATAAVITLASGVALGEVSQLTDGSLHVGREIALLLALAIIPTAVGHSILNLAMVKLRGQVVAITSLGQVVFATLLAVPVLGEVPQAMFFPACGLIAAGALVVIVRR